MPFRLPPPKRGRWVERWSVESDDLERDYVVSRDAYGEFGCSCPQWKFRREQCKHIQTLQVWLRGGSSAPPPSAPVTGEAMIEPVRNLLRERNPRHG